MTREEALQHARQELSSGLSYEAMVNKLFDDIGSCKTCAFLGDREVHCGQHNRTVPRNGYCWLYEKEKK